MKRTIKNRSPMAKALESPLFAHKAIKSRKLYSRKIKHKEQSHG